MDFAASPFEIKSLADSGQIEGLLAGFGDLDHYGDKLLFGCLNKSLAKRTTPLPMLLHHDMHRPIGAWKEWQERPEGLYVKGEMTLAVSDAQEAYVLARAGALTGLSIGFLPIKVSQDRDGNRAIAEADLLEGSLVTVPAHDRARITAVKSFTSARDIAELLQQAGLSGRKAKLAAGAAWKSINDQDDDAAAEAEAARILNESAARIAAIGGRQ